jgi:hypothetical protein
VLDHLDAHVVANRILIPHRPGEQVLHRVRAGLPGVLGDLVERDPASKTVTPEATSTPVESTSNRLDSTAA